MYLNKRTGRVKLAEHTLKGDLWATWVHGKTGQALSDGWLTAGDVIHYDPDYLPSAVESVAALIEQDPLAPSSLRKVSVYDGGGMRVQVDAAEIQAELV